MTRFLRRMFRRVVARLRLDLNVVCEESARLGPYDYHDYHDTEHGQPDHFVTLTCKRCGKQFLM